MGGKQTFAPRRLNVSQIQPSPFARRKRDGMDGFFYLKPSREIHMRAGPVQDGSQEAREFDHL